MDTENKIKPVGANSSMNIKHAVGNCPKVVRLGI